VCGVLSGLERPVKAIPQAKPISPSAIPNRLSNASLADDKRVSPNMSQGGTGTGVGVGIADNGHGHQDTSIPCPVTNGGALNGSTLNGGIAPAAGTGTGIPKPTAAVKGTSKPSRDSHGSLISLKSEVSSALLCSALLESMRILGMRRFSPPLFCLVCLSF